MKRFSLIWPLLSTGLIVYISGCSEKGDQIINPSFSSDQEYFSSVISNDGFFATEEPNLEDGDALPPEYSSEFFKEDAAIVPFRFGKKVKHVQRSITYQQEGDTVVIATATKTITGEFIIAA